MGWGGCINVHEHVRTCVMRTGGVGWGGEGWGGVGWGGGVSTFMNMCEHV